MSKVEGGGVPVGTQLNGIYEIDQRVAMGGMGEVYIGHNIQTGDRLAIKMILPELAHNQTILDLFRKEASTLNRLYHEAIVRYYVFSVDPTLDRPYLAMEYAAGPSLVDRLRERPLTGDELDVLRHRVASGLFAAHKLGVFHRDISPDNVILVEGAVENAKIIDFGIAKSTSAEGTLIGGGFAGKLNYVSPEQLGLGGGEVTGKSDIYSLGLVLAEAAIGHPLPMGGTQVEVLEKRRTVPDLSEVPERIRPLIEWMLQPDPANRPDDMHVVAEWGQPVRQPTVPPNVTAVPPHITAVPPRPGAAARGDLEKKRGFPWLAAGAVTVVAAGAAVYFVMQSGEAPGPAPKPPVELTTPTVASLSAPQTGEVSAKQAEVGRSYKWISPAFNYSGDKTAVKVTLDGTLPAGLEFEDGGDATGVIYGFPEQAGEARFRIRAEGPGGQEATLAALLVINPAKVEPAPQVSTTTPSTLATQPVDSGSGGDVSVAASNGSTGGGSAPARPEASGGDAGSGSALSTLPVAGGQGDPGRAASEPTVSLNLPSLAPSQPTAGGGVSVGGPSGGASVGGGELSALPSTGSAAGGGSALSTLPVAGGQGDPGQAASEPTVSLNLPSLAPSQPSAGVGGVSVGGSSGGASVGGGELSALSSAGGAAGGGSALSTLPVAGGQGDPGQAASEPTVSLNVPSLAPSGQVAGGGGVDVDALQLPKTGVGATPAPQALDQPAAGSGDSSMVVVNIPQGENRPPKILDHILAPIEGSHGDDLNVGLGRFDDEDGAGALSLRLEGRLPNGIEFVGTGGEARLRGRPAESGNFSLKVVAADPQGLVSSFPVNLSILAPTAFRDLREYITGYNGGDCFLSRPLELGARKARIEVFVAEADPLFRFDGDFKRDRGFEAAIEGRLITPEQCGLMHALDQVGPNALDNRLQVRIDKDQLRSGETLSGMVSGGTGVRLFLYDNGGGVSDLAQYVREGAEGASFRLPLQANGPQVLIAAIPEPASGLGPSASLEQLLGAAQRGQAALALGYIVVEK